MLPGLPARRDQSSARPPPVKGPLRRYAPLTTSPEPQLSPWDEPPTSGGLWTRTEPVVLLFQVKQRLCHRQVPSRPIGFARYAIQLPKPAAQRFGAGHRPFGWEPPDCPCVGGRIVSGSPLVSSVTLVRQRAKMTDRRRGVHASSRGLLIVASVIVISGISMVRTPLWGHDEAIHLIYPELMAAGRTPNHDFFSPYGPGHFRLLQAIFSLTGPSLLVERVVGTAYHLAIAVGAMWLVRGKGLPASRFAGLTCAMVFIGFVPVAFAWLGGLALLIWSLALLAHPGRAQITFIAGVLGGLVAFWRPEMAVLLLSAIPLLWKQGQARQYLGGVVVGLVPLVAHLVANAGGVYHDIFIGRLGVNAQSDLGSVGVWVWLVLALTCASILFLAERGRTDRVAASAAILGTLMAPQALQRIDNYHATFVACFVLPVGAAFLLDIVQVRSGVRMVTERMPNAGVTAEIAMLVVVAALAGMTLGMPVATVTTRGRSVMVRTEDAAHLRAVIAAVRDTSPSGSRIFIGPQDLSRPDAPDDINIVLYHLLPEYLARAYFIDLAPGTSERRGSHLAADVLTADTLILNHNSVEGLHSMFPNLTRGSDEANRAVHNNYCIVRTIGQTQVLRRGQCQPTLRPGRSVNL